MKKIGIVVADTEEFAPLANRIKLGEYTESFFLKRQILKCVPNENFEVYAVLCGIGKVNAAAATTHLIDIGCDYIINYGLSGGISGINRGEICFCDKFLEHDFNLTSIGYKPCEKPGQTYIYKSNEELLKLVKPLCPNVKVGTAVSGDCFVNDDSLRSFLKEEFNAMCCDMETAAIAYVCEYSKTPFAVLRRISDDAGSDAAESYTIMNTSGETQLSDLAFDLALAIGNL